MIKTLAILFALLMCSSAIFAQKITITGYITDQKSGEKLIGANVYNANNFVGTVTNSYGFFSLTLNQGPVKLTVSYVGYSTYQEQLNLTNDQNLNIELKPTIEIDEVVVEGKGAAGGVRSSQMSVVEIPIRTIKNLPVLLGEADIIKTIQLLPGVQSGTEGMSGMYVRGGGPDQNLILLDGVPVYNVNHLFGFFSVFNPDAIHNVKLMKGGFPARYGGRLSSVLDISMKEGNTKKFKGSAAVGIISAKLALEGPIGDNTSFIVSGRRTYIDILAYPIIQLARASEDLENMRFGYFFQDFNAKINHTFSQKSRLYVSAYMGKDKFYSYIKDKGTDLYEGSWSYEERMQLWWGNITAAVRWNYVINKKLFSNTTFTASRYKMFTGLEFIEDDVLSDKLTYDSGILDYSGKIDFDYFPVPNHSVKFGLSEIYHTYNPGVTGFTFTEDGDQVNTTFGNNKLYAHELGAYIEDDIRLGALLKINVGMRLSGFKVRDKFYYGLEPRISGRYLVSDKLSIKASYANMNQYINLLTNSTIGLPTDLWVPVTDKIKPQYAHQVAAGAVYAINNDIDISIEGFYKYMDNIVEYKSGASYFSVTDDWEDKIAMGEGWSRGLEFLLMKKYGKTTGWIGYTWSKTDRRFNRFGQEIGFGKKFPYKFDRRHDISFVLTHNVNERIDVGLTWIYGTGNAVTMGFETYPEAIANTYENYYWSPELTYIENRNNFRMPAYHRLDLSINFKKQKKIGLRTWNLSIYNAYNRKNPFFLNWETDYDSQKRKLYQYSLFPILPSVSYKLDF